MPETKKFKFSLRPLQEDKRDFQYSKVFGSVKVPDIDFVVAEPIKIEDQKDTDYCPAEATSSVAEDHEGVDLDPVFSFAAIKSIDKHPEDWGSDLRSAGKAGCKIGFLKKKDSPYTIDDPRETIVYLENWPKELLKKAEIHKQQSFFRIDKKKDVFEAMRNALWQNRKSKNSIFTGVVWRAGWTEAEKGIIPIEETEEFGGHALKIYGQKIIDKKCFLTAQLSNGTDIGDNGIYYFPKEVINRDFTFGAFCFHDMPTDEAKQKAWTWQIKLIEMIKKYLNNLFK